MERGRRTKHIPASTLDTIESSLRQLGLFYSIEFRNTDAGIWQDDKSDSKRLNQIADIYIAKNQATLDDMKQARKTNDDMLLGIALGYPESAVRAYSTKNKLMVFELDPETQLSEVGQLTYFALSKDNWKNELAVVETWVEAIKANSKIMWNQLIGYVKPIDEEVIELVLKASK